MGGQTWLIDGSIIATKIKNASGTEPESYDLSSRTNEQQSNPTRTCPKCSHIIDNNDVSQKWPGLPKGVRFDPTDSELLLHLLAKSGKCGANPHPFINEFILTIEACDGICYTHPQKLPGVKQDGSASHFFHRTFKAYNTGTRKRQKVHNSDQLGVMRWHKTGKTKPIFVDGTQLGCKKIMVLYLVLVKGGKPEKTNWVMHQYHLGTGEDEMNEEYVVSKVFCQQQLQSKQNDINKLDPVTANRLKLEKLEYQRLDCEPTTDVVSSDRELKTIGAETINDVENWNMDIDNVALDDIHADNIHVDNNNIVIDGENRHVGDNADGCEDNSHSQDFSPFDSKNIWNTEELAVAGEDLFHSQPFLAYYARSGGAECLRNDLEECKRLNSIDKQDIVSFDKLSSECLKGGDQEECKRLICLDDQEDIVLDAQNSDLICIGDDQDSVFDKQPSDCEKIDSNLEEFKRLIRIDNQDFPLDASSDKEMRLSQLVFSSDDSLLGW